MPLRVRPIAVGIAVMFFFGFIETDSGKDGCIGLGGGKRDVGGADRLQAAGRGDLGLHLLEAALRELITAVDARRMGFPARRGALVCVDSLRPGSCGSGCRGCIRSCQPLLLPPPNP